MSPLATKAEIIQTLREQLPVLRQRFGVRSLSLFGSRVRGDARPDSDLDLLVDFTETPSLLRFVELEYYLSDLLSLRVDLVMAEALKPRSVRQILAEREPV